MQPMTRVTELEHAGGCRLSLTFSEGTSGTVDLSAVLTGPTVAGLKDPDFFSKAMIGPSGEIEWPGDIHFDAEGVRRLLREQR